MVNFLKRAWTEIHLDRLTENYNKCKSLLSKNAEIMAVVKANAYGHGDSIIAPHLQDLGVDWFAVSNLNEAKHLRNLGITGEILVLGYTPPENVCELLEFDIIQTVLGYEHALSLAKNVPFDDKLRVHIKMDTGMGRIGIRYDNYFDYANECEEIYKINRLEVEGLFTHFSSADSDDEEDFEYTLKQKELFFKIKKELDKRLLFFDKIHYLNSAAATYLNDENSDFARFGVMLYGLHPNFQKKLPFELSPVMELKATVVQVKTIEEGANISYGRTFVANREMKVATLAIGYADGYSRLLSSKAEVLIKGKRCKSVGRICMDQMVVDCTDVDVKVGDTATLFGIDGEEKITPDDLAAIYYTIGYEIICGISKRVPRVIKNNGEIINVTEYM